MPGLPPYGPMAIPFPPEFAGGGHEGFVVEFELADGSTWAGNFEPGLGGLHDVRAHPNGHDVLVSSAGSLWQVDPATRVGEELSSAVFSVWPDGGALVYSVQDIAFVCVGPTGVEWRTRRISWDGFRELHIEGDRLAGEAWSPIENRWMPFVLDLATGAAEGGSYPVDPPWDQAR